MDHVAIMNKSWGLIPKILDGRKKIESRWGINKCAPWEKVKIGDIVYFKNSGGKVLIKTKVEKIKEFSDLTPKKVKEILIKYGGDGGISVTNLKNSFEWAKKKRYCTLIYLKEVKKVTPFNINKKGFGIGAAWISVKDINSTKVVPKK